MDYLTATRTANNYTCKCGSRLEYRIAADGEYEVYCPADREHQGVIPQPTPAETWAGSLRRQAEIMKGER